MNQELSVLTGASAGASEAFIVVPFELIKIRLQDQVGREFFTVATRYGQALYRRRDARQTAARSGRRASRDRLHRAQFCIFNA